jgi:hypothetical protein
MAVDITGMPWVFDASGQGEGLGTAQLDRGTFTAAASDICTMAGHGYTTGNGPVQVTTSAADQPAGLSLLTDYWVIRLSASTFNLASSLANALAGTAVDIADAGTGTHKITSLPVFNNPLYIRTIIFTTAGTSGATEVTEGNGGRSLTGSVVMSTNDRQLFYIESKVDAVYINALPTSAKVYIYAGEY